MAENTDVVSVLVSELLIHNEPGLCEYGVILPYVFMPVALSVKVVQA